MTHRTRFAPLSASGAVVAILAASCTLLGNREVSQCSEDKDCPSNRCNAIEHLCLEALPVTTEAGLPDTTPPPVESSAGCTGHATCVTGEVCVSGQCTAVGAATTPCSFLPILDKANDAHRAEQAFVVGIYLFGGTGGPEVKAADLALSQINDVLALRNEPLRIGGIYCSKSETLQGASAVKTAAFLKKIGAHAMIGQLEASELANTAFRAEVQSGDLMVMSTLGNSTELQEPTPNNDVRYRFLVDQLQAQVTATTNPYNDAIAEAEQRVTAANAGVRPDPIVVRFVVATDSSGTETIEAGPLYQKLKDSTVFATGTWDVAELKVKSAFEKTGTDPDSAAFTAIKDAPVTPHIVIGIGGDEVKGVITSIETLSSSALARKPLWIVGPRNKVFNLKLSGLVVPSFIKRVIGVDFDGSDLKSDDLRAKAKANGAQAFDALYDGLFALTFGAARARVKRPGAVPSSLTGTELRKGFDEVLLKQGAADAFDLPLGFDSAIDAITKTNKAIHMNGVTGPFELSTGAKIGARISTAVAKPYFCFRKGQEDTAHYVTKEDLADGTKCER